MWGRTFRWISLVSDFLREKSRFCTLPKHQRWQLVVTAILSDSSTPSTEGATIVGSQIMHVAPTSVIVCSVDVIQSPRRSETSASPEQAAATGAVCFVFMPWECSRMKGSLSTELIARLGHHVKRNASACHHRACRRCVGTLAGNKAVESLLVFVVAPANMSFVSSPSAIAHMFDPSGWQGDPSNRDFKTRVMLSKSSWTNLTNLCDKAVVRLKPKRNAPPSHTHNARSPITLLVTFTLDGVA